MKFIFRALLLSTAALVIFQGCFRDELIIPSNPSNLPNKLGVYVLSEGAGNPNQSALSFFSYANNEFSFNITYPSLLGIYPDGLINYNNRFYVTDQGSPGGQGKIYSMDTNGIITATNTFGKNPYSIAAVNNKAYCTNGPDSSVSVIDINSLTEIKKIKVGAFPQEIMSINLEVFVCNTRNISHGIADSTISVINAVSDAVVANIKVNYAPSSLALSKDGYLLAGSSGSNGIIYKINSTNHAKVDSFVVNCPLVKDISVDYLTNDIYFISSTTTITRLNLVTRELLVFISGTPIIYLNGYAFDWKRRKHYIADAQGFTNNGYFYIYNENGTLETTFGTRERPRRILVRN